MAAAPPGAQNPAYRPAPLNQSVMLNLKAVPMTKKELIGKIVEKANALDEDALLEILYIMDNVDWGADLDDIETQYKESLKDIEKGDFYTMDEVLRGAGKE
jgi:hypothetical protein